MSENQTLEVLSTIHHDGEVYPPGGELLTVTAGQAAPLIAVGAARPATSAGTSQRAQRLAEAIADMVQADPERQQAGLWTTDGAPEVDDLSRRVGGKKVSAKERDAAWDAWQAAQGGGA